MSLIGGVAARLQRQDVLQVLALLLAVLVVALNVNWPDGGARVNESWAPVASLRNSLLAFVALAFGAHVGTAATAPADRRAEGGSTLLALLVVMLLTAPFELAAQAASYPAIPFLWPASAAVLTVTGFFGVGLAVGRLVRGRHSGALLLLAVPAVMAGLVWLDLAVGIGLTNPWAAPLAFSPGYLAFCVAASLLGLVWLWPPRAARAVGEAEAS